MKLLSLFFILFLLSNGLFSQIKENTTFIDSVSSSIGNIKEELIKIEENYYVIQPLLTGREYWSFHW